MRANVLPCVVSHKYDNIYRRTAPHLTYLSLGRTSGSARPRRDAASRWEENVVGEQASVTSGVERGMTNPDLSRGWTSMDGPADPELTPHAQLITASPCSNEQITLNIGAGLDKKASTVSNCAYQTCATMLI